MYNKKVESLITKSKAVGSSKFVEAGMTKSAETLSGNGALKYSTTGNDFVDQFGKLGSYKSPRSFKDIASDMSLLYSQDALAAVKFALYIRTINRVVTLPDGSKTTVPQKGGELIHEGIMRMLWLHENNPTAFWSNIPLFVSLGKWDDIFKMLSYDLQYHGWEGRKLDWNKFGNFILSALENSNTVDLVKKWLPRIRSNSACKTIEAQADNVIAKWLCSLLFGEKSGGRTYKQYRNLKSSGTAHEWQKLISQKKFDRIDFNKIHGRALSKLVKSKFLKNQGLSESYSAWVTKPSTEVKYTGFVHELFSNMHKAITKNDEETINKQFETLVKKAGEKQQTNFIVVRDTSASMGSIATGTNMTCYNVGKALALYFSEFLTGEFSNAWIEFNSDAKMHKWKGKTPVDKWRNDSSSFIGNTNFQRVISLFVRLKEQGVSEKDFPTGILCISDSEFDPSCLDETNVQTAKKTLLGAGFSEEYVNNFVIVLWNLQSRFYGRGTGEKFETYGDVPNVFYFSGYSAATVSFLTDKIRNASELFDAAMNQEVLHMVKV